MEKDTLDLKDKKILYILAQEARTPPSIIAKQVGLSKDAVKYRIKQMEKKRIIYNYIAVIDNDKLGFRAYDLFIRLNIPPGQEKQVTDYFDNHPNICWSCFMSGQWNFFVELLCSSNREFHEMTKDIAAKFSSMLEDYEFHLVGDTYRLTQIVEPLYDGKGLSLNEESRPRGILTGQARITLDDVEKRILTAICEDAVLPVHKIAEKAKVSSEVVRYRLRKLREEGVLLRTTPTIDYALLDFVEYILLIKLRNLTPEREDKLRRRVQEMPLIKYCYRAQGEQTFFAILNAKSVDEVEAMLKSIRADSFDIIKSVEYYHVTQHNRFIEFPDAMSK
jgi:DNA-binding Lrp family transcriptional regulator